MKNISLTLLFVAFYLISHAQHFKLEQSYIVSKAGDTTRVNIKKETDNKVTYVRIGETYAWTVKKEELKAWKNNEWWSVEIPRNSAGRYEVVGVVQAPGISKADLYTRAKLWFVNNYKDAKEVLEMDDKESGLLQGTGFTQMNTINAQMWHTVQVEIKDNKFRYTIRNFDIKTPSYTIGTSYIAAAEYTLESRLDNEDDPRKELSRKIKTEVIEFINAEVLSLTEKLTAAASSAGDW